jgi:pyridoxine kinase
MQPGAVIVISSHVVRGSVGNRAAVFALERLGIEVCAVPTIILPWHPGHGRATSIVPDMNRFSNLVRDIQDAPWLSSVSVILSGYLGSAGQAACVANLVQSAREANPEVKYVCDPVIGDAGRLYVARETAEAIRDQLVPVADLATPNLSEFQWLTGKDSIRIDDIRRAAGMLRAAEVLITSAPGHSPDCIGNLFVSGQNALLASHPVVEDPPKGAGDLLTALFAGNSLLGTGAKAALARSTASVYQIITETKRIDGSELALARFASVFINPSLEIRVEQLEPEEL